MNRQTFLKSGFRAWENTYLIRRPVEEQERISQAVQKLGMEFYLYFFSYPWDKRYCFKTLGINNVIVAWPKI